MYRREFELLAGIGKSRYFDLLADPAVSEQLDAGIDENGRYVNRRKALVFIQRLIARRTAARRQVAENLGGYATRTPPPRGRACPACGRRITLKPTICRHCGENV